MWRREEGFLGGLVAVGLRAGLDQRAAEGDPVGDGRAEAGVAEGLVPGAHPRPDPLTPLHPDALAEAFEQAPGAGILAPCTRFDAVTLTGLPPTFIAAAELDVFRDEDLSYATRLQASGVPVELHLYPGAYHAWDLFAPEAAVSAAYVRAWYAYLRRQFTARQL
ncbi:alpha/beta hydrolase [Streptomyces hydrogenans]|uniref:alpha/beta hydrolase n=1 Tax=Streptomyces hydrogenans TaxID=1873719 RepID=UPI00367415F2